MSVIRHVVWKELRLNLLPAGRVPRHHLMQALPLMAIALLIPVLGPVFLSREALGAAVIIAAAILLSTASIVPISFAGDAFAGERERHTQETVLTAPVTPRQLMWGKLTAQLIVLGASLVIAALLTFLLLSLPTIPRDVRAISLIALPFAVPFMGLLGILILISANLASLRSSTVKEANTRFMVYMMIALLIGFLPSAFIAPLTILYGTNQDSPLLLLALLGAQLLAIAAFLGYVAYMVAQIMRLTRADNFRVDV